MMQLLTTFEDDVFQMWNLSITKKMTQSLSKPLLCRDSDNDTLRVNFGKDLMAVLREVILNMVILPMRKSYFENNPLGKVPQKRVSYARFSGYSR